MPRGQMPLEFRDLLAILDESDLFDRDVRRVEDDTVDPVFPRNERVKDGSSDKGLTEVDGRVEVEVRRADIVVV